MGDPALGTNQTVVIDLETSWGSDPASPNARQLVIVSDGLVAAQDLIENPSIRGDFSASDPALGRKSGAGALVFIPNVTMLPMIGKLGAGSSGFATTGVGDPYTHTATFGKAKALSAVLERAVDIDGTLRYYHSNGARINRLSFPVSDTGFLQISADMAAKSVSLASSAYDPTPVDWRSGTPLEHLQLASADVEIGGSDVGYIASGNVDINFNLFMDDYRVGGSGTRGSLVQGKTTVTGSLKLAVDAVAVLTLIDTTTPTSLALTWTTAANRTAKLSVPRVYLSKTGAALSGDGPVFVDVNFQAAYDSGIGGMAQLIVVNDQAGAVYA